MKRKELRVEIFLLIVTIIAAIYGWYSGKPLWLAGGSGFFVFVLYCLLESVLVIASSQSNAPAQKRKKRGLFNRRGSQQQGSKQRGSQQQGSKQRGSQQQGSKQRGSQQQGSKQGSKQGGKQRGKQQSITDMFEAEDGLYIIVSNGQVWPISDDGTVILDPETGQQVGTVSANKQWATFFASDALPFGIRG
jgi:hypothetical protein